MKDFYKILGVTEEEKNLSKDEFKKVIKKKYRKLSLKYHPDKNPDDKEAENKFKDINEAYSTLSDDNKKMQYDMGGQSLFDRMYTHHRGFYHRPHIYKGEDLFITVDLTLEEIFSGVEKEITYNVDVACKTCNGIGGEELVDCSRCNGSGTVMERLGNQHHFIMSTSTCPTCRGSGKEVKNPCTVCSGSGLQQDVSKVKIDIPKGVTHGSHMKSPTAGNACRNNLGINGDLFISINELKHPKFMREGDNLIIEKEVPIVDVLLGGDVTVEDLTDKKYKINVKPNSRDNSFYRLNGKGMAKMPATIRRGDSLFGDLLVKIKHKYPEQLSKEDKKILKKLKESKNFN